MANEDFRIQLMQAATDQNIAVVNGKVVASSAALDLLDANGIGYIGLDPPMPERVTYMVNEGDLAKRLGGLGALDEFRASNEATKSAAR